MEISACLHSFTALSARARVTQRKQTRWVLLRRSRSPLHAALTRVLQTPQGRAGRERPGLLGLTEEEEDDDEEFPQCRGLAGLCAG